MTNNELLNSMADTFAKCHCIADSKNKDYANDDDALRNFKLVESMDLCSKEQGIIVRMCDKLYRISNLIKQDGCVKDESIEDTLHDIINYSAILIASLRSKGDTRCTASCSTSFNLR
jgi:hypothetical protein